MTISVTRNLFIGAKPELNMAIGVTLFIVGVLIAVIWILIEMKRLRHKTFAIFLIVLILFTYFSFSYVAKKNDVQLSSISGLMSGGKLYLSWLGSLFGNVKSITGYATDLDWQDNNSTRGG